LDRRGFFKALAAAPVAIKALPAEKIEPPQKVEIKLQAETEELPVVLCFTSCSMSSYPKIPDSDY